MFNYLHRAGSRNFNASISALNACFAAWMSLGLQAQVSDDTVRPQDSRSFIPVNETGFDALAGAPATDRWTGVLNGASYRVEVPKTAWNGQLVMWAHGYAGTGAQLIVGNPLIRRHLLAKGYAWAASSYSKNYYDVRAGIEDTNALALHFTTIAAENGRTLPNPSKIFISGVSMGGHISVAAVDREAQIFARNKVFYKGAVPMCGVLGDTELFNYLGAYQVAAQQLSGFPMDTFPMPDFAALTPAIQAALWTSFPTQTNAQGDRLKTAVKYLSGGERPFFAEGWANAANQQNFWNSIGGDGKLNGIVTENIVDTRDLSFKIDFTSQAQTPLDKAFNRAVFRIQSSPFANPLRSDGLRWVPQANADISVPAVAIHTLGDLYVPFKMEQIFAERAKARGTDKWLVQRAIRDVGHCAFTAAEASDAFDAMVKWEAEGIKPGGDDVSLTATVAMPSYGCAFTNNQQSREDYTSASVRANLQAKYPACPEPETLRQ